MTAPPPFVTLPRATVACAALTLLLGALALCRAWGRAWAPGGGPSGRRR